MAPDWLRRALAFKSAHLFGSWSNWAEKAGEYTGTAKRFGQALEKRGFVPHKHRQLGRGFIGIKLKEGLIGQDGNFDAMS